MDWTAIFTGLLVLVTGILVAVTIWVAWRQQLDARVLQRAYVSALPGGISTTTRGELLAHVEFKNVGHLPASQVKWLLKFTASDDGEWSPPAVDDKDLRPAGVLPIGISVTTGTHGIAVPQPWPKYLYAWGGSLIWMASVRSGGRIFAIATTPRSENSKLVGAISFAKRMAVTTNMGTMQTERRKRRRRRGDPAAGLRPVTALISAPFSQCSA